MLLCVLAGGSIGLIQAQRGPIEERIAKRKREQSQTKPTKIVSWYESRRNQQN